MNLNAPSSNSIATQADMHNCIQKVATGPEYSKNLSFEEAKAGMELILRGEADPVQAAVYLIALRMKRETHAENEGILQAILDARVHVISNAEEIVDIGDPYNGQLRGLPLAPFIAPVLSACGVPAFSHGVGSVGPKFGITHKMVLDAAGVDVDRSPQQVADQMANTDIGWGYVDQSNYCPSLYALISLREKMIKRTVITTIEVLAKPISGSQRTHLLTGFVHKAYPAIYANLARFAGYHSVAVVRGVEGGVLPSLQQISRFYRCTAGAEDRFIEIEPTQLGIDQPSRAVRLPDGQKSLQQASRETKYAAARTAAELGIEALKNAPGAARDSLMYGVAIVLLHLERYPNLKDAAQFVKKVIASGDAYDKFAAHK
ncbi:MAG: anthranilate phosphoribosyltransferase [Gammaproteobacteria bacterium]|nr:anthranilate phosphoribosyltransferase [Gammaproteobacteria bacterium]